MQDSAGLEDTLAFQLRPMQGNPESGKFLLVKSGILGFGIRNTAQGIWNPTNN